VEEGERRGRWVGFRDADGRLHALSPTSVIAICAADDDDEGATLLLPGGRIIRLSRSVETVIDWLEQPPQQR
jgi:hypothetical protein